MLSMLASTFGNYGKPLANYMLRWPYECNWLASGLPITCAPGVEILVGIISGTERQNGTTAYHSRFYKNMLIYKNMIF